MKLILAAFAFIFMVKIAMAQDFVTLDNSTLDNHPLIRDLRDLGAAYVGQQLIYHPNKTWNRDHYNVTDTLKVERKVTPNVTYYRYTVILTEISHNSIVKAGYTINYKPSNGGFVVSSYYYRIIADNLNGQRNYQRPVANNIKDYNNNHTDNVDPNFEGCLEIAISKAIESKLLPQAQYYRRFVYDAFFVAYDSIGSQSATSTCLVKLVNDKDEFYRIQISFPRDLWGPDPSTVQFYVYPNA